MMSETENAQPEQDAHSSSDSEPISLEGKGWDILVGGQQNAAQLGGADPFDQSPDDAEASAIMSASETPPGETTGVPPEEAFWDRGRGSGAPEPPVPTDENVAAPPRDLSPEELGAVPIPPGIETPSAAPATPEVLSVSETAPSAPAEFPVPTLSFEELTAPPASPASAEAPSTVDMGPSVPEVPAPGPFGAPFGAAPDAGMPFGAAPAPFGGPAAPPPLAPSVPVEPTPLTAPQAVPVQPAGVYSAMDVGAERIYDPFRSERYVAPMPTEPEKPPDEALKGHLITQERIDALWDEINETYNLAINDVRGYFKTTEQAIIDLKKARELLLSGAENYDNAEQLVKMVKARLRLEEKVRQWSKNLGTWLALYLVIWLLLLSVLSLVTDHAQEIAAQLVPLWMAQTILPGLFGGLGGVVGALWVLIKHIAKERDFDPIHTPWYVTNPFLGFALGVITYLLLLAGGGLIGIEGFADAASNSLFTYALCIIVGFNQNVLWSLVDRVIKAVVPPTESRAATEQPSSQSGG